MRSLRDLLVALGEIGVAPNDVKLSRRLYSDLFERAEQTDEETEDEEEE